MTRLARRSDASYRPGGPTSDERNRRALDAIAAAVQRARAGGGPSLPQRKTATSPCESEVGQNLVDEEPIAPEMVHPGIEANPLLDDSEQRARAVALAARRAQATASRGQQPRRERRVETETGPRRLVSRWSELLPDPKRPTETFQTGVLGRSPERRLPRASVRHGVPPVDLAPTSIASVEDAPGGPMDAPARKKRTMFDVVSRLHDSLEATPDAPFPPGSCVPRRGPSGARRRPALVVATTIVAIAVVVAGGIAAGLTLSSGSTTRPLAPPHRSTRSSRAVPAHSATRSKAGSTTSTSGVSAASTAPTTATTTAATKSSTTTVPASAPTAPAAAGSVGAPQVASASPVSGAAGQTVTVTGSGFYSANGQVTAYFGGAPAPTSCPSQSSCTVTVPDLGVAHSTTVTIVTSSGTSNAVGFDYK